MQKQIKDTDISNQTWLFAKQPWITRQVRFVHKSWIALLVTVLTLTSPLPVLADEEFILFWEVETAGDFLQKQKQTYTPLFSPTSDGTLSTVIRTGWYGSDGRWGIGLMRQAISTIDYNQELGELYYDLYQNKDLTGRYSHLAGRFTSYRRQDIVLDVNLAHGPWQIQGGVQCMEGSDLFCFDIQDATASPAAGNEIPYDVRGRYALWKGYADDRGYGIGYHIALQYQPSEQFSVKLCGSDLGAGLLWRPIDEYHGTVNLDLVREEDGVNYVHAPLEGIYLSDGWLHIPLLPLWRAGMTYHLSPSVTLDPWVQYHGGWEAGVGGTWMLQHGPKLSLGVEYHDMKWFCQASGEWWGIRLELAANIARSITNYRLGVRVGAF